MAEPVPISLAAQAYRLGYEDYLVLPDDGRRYEILDGELAMSPAPTPFHQTVSRRVQFVLYQRELAGEGLVFDAPIDLILTDHDIVQPDLLFLTADQRHLVTDRGIEGAPALVVEILSPSTRRRDVLVKSTVYARCGVPEYWVVDPEIDRLEVFVLRDGAYVSALTADAPDVVERMGVALDLGMVFARD